MNTSSNGVFTVIAIIIVFLIGIGLYLSFAGTTTTVPVTMTATSTTPAPTPQPSTVVTTSTTTTTAPSTTTRPFVLTAAQKQALISAGVSSTSIPATVSIAQEACFVAALGVSRIVEIKAGAVPTLAEFAKVKTCF